MEIPINQLNKKLSYQELISLISNIINPIDTRFFSVDTARKFGDIFTSLVFSSLDTDDNIHLNIDIIPVSNMDNLLNNRVMVQEAIYSIEDDNSSDLVVFRYYRSSGSNGIYVLDVLINQRIKNGINIENKEKDKNNNQSIKSDIKEQVTGLTDQKIKSNEYSIEQLEKILNQSEILQSYNKPENKDTKIQAETFIDRLKKEHTELVQRISKLDTFIDTEKYVKLDEFQQFTLLMQLSIMNQYASILSYRIKKELER